MSFHPLTPDLIQFAYRPKGRTLWVAQNGVADDPRNVRKRWQDEDYDNDINGFSTFGNGTVRIDASTETAVSAGKIKVNTEKIKANTEKTKLDEMLVVSTPKRYGLNQAGKISALKGKFYFDELEGKGQTIYLLEHGWYKNEVIYSIHVTRSCLY